MVNITKCRKALTNFINGKFRLCVPPQSDDDDILISDALDELSKLRFLLSDKVVNVALRREYKSPTSDENRDNLMELYNISNDLRKLLEL